MDARGLVRSARVLGAARGVRAVRWAWRRSRTDSAVLPRRAGERARVPGTACGAEARPGGGLIRFERSSLRVRVAAGGSVFLGWDGAGPEPSYALDGRCPKVDPRAGLEPDKDGGWRVVSERVMVAVSRHGAVEVRTPGGVVLRRDAAPRWWEGADGSGARWVQRSRVAPDARFYGLGGRAVGPRLPDGTYRLWNTDPVREEPRTQARHVTMPVQLVVADVGCHLVFHDSTWEGSVTLAHGEEGAGSGHDRPGRCEVRMSGGPLRYWLITGPPARVLRGWAALTGTPARPPVWALGYQQAMPDCGSEQELLRAVADHREHGLPLRAVHLGTGGQARFPPPAWDAEGHGVRLVAAVDSAVRAGRGSVLYVEGAAIDAFVRDARGREVRCVTRAGDAAYPDFTDPRVRKWWGGSYAERLALGFSGVCHEGNEPTSPTVFGEATLPRSARHDLEGRGGDHREAHNVYALAMAKAAYEGILEQRPAERPFVLSRAGWAGSQRYGGVAPGETVSDWDGLRASLALVLGLALSGVPYSGPDIGGRGVPGARALSAELYLRWFQLCAYLPLFRGRDAALPWRFGPDILGHARAAAERRERLLPYFVTLAHLAQRTGAPYVRPLWWHRFQDRGLRECDDAFLLGDALLVAPVLDAGARSRRVRLPRGCWYDTATGVRHEGACTVTLDAPLGRVPVLARAGAAVPVTDGGSGLELEVWPPPPGRTGSGLLIREPGDGWGRAEVERLTVRMRRGVPVVTGEDDLPVELPVRVCG